MNKETKNIIATLELANGNAEVGTMWLAHKLCNEDTTLKEIFEWRDSFENHIKGRLILTKAS